MGRLLLVEDDDGDALIVEELLADGGERFELARATTLRDAVGMCRYADCVLLDLGLPDAHGLDALEKLTAAAPQGVAIIVLTGLADRPMGIAALERGAEDYLVKGEVDGPGLARAVRYAIERSRADAAAQRLRDTQRRAVDNERLARGLLPSIDMAGAGLTTVTSYRPGGGDALLGGDFLDAVVAPDGTVRAVIGDVCGHGPDEAAIGVALRFTWRALASEGIPAPRVLAAVEQALLDQTTDGRFVTICDIEIDPDRRHLTVRRAGHPPPMLLRPEVRWLDEAPPSPPLGVVIGTIPPPTTIALPDGWQVLLLTDGVYEGRHDDDRLGLDGLVTVVRGIEPGAPGLADRLIGAVTEINGGPLEDDVALMLLGPSSR